MCILYLKIYLIAFEISVSKISDKITISLRISIIQLEVYLTDFVFNEIEMYRLLRDVS